MTENSVFSSVGVVRCIYNHNSIDKKVVEECILAGGEISAFNLATTSEGSGLVMAYS